MSSSSRFVRPIPLVALALVPVVALLGACGERPEPPDSFAVSAATFPDSVAVAWGQQTFDECGGEQELRCGVFLRLMGF